MAASHSPHSLHWFRHTPLGSGDLISQEDPDPGKKPFSLLSPQSLWCCFWKSSEGSLLESESSPGESGREDADTLCPRIPGAPGPAYQKRHLSLGLLLLKVPRNTLVCSSQFLSLTTEKPCCDKGHSALWPCCSVVTNVSLRKSMITKNSALLLIQNVNSSNNLII